MSALRHSLPLLELRAAAQGLISGYASVFGGVDSYGDTVAPGAFDVSLAKHRAAGTMPVMLWSHRMEEPIGRWTALAEDRRGLVAEGQINLKTTAGREAFEHLRAGDVSGLSIGFRLGKNGAEPTKHGLLLKEIDLHEISAVTIPADGAARIHSVKSHAFKPATVRNFEEALEDMGFSRREARNIAARGFACVAEPGDDSHELISAIKAATLSFTKA